MDPHQPQPHFFPFPATALGAAAVQNSAPLITPAQFIPEVPQNHVAADVVPSPAQPPSHPSYTDMIYAAITALKERDGSSRRAIAKYIERVFIGLPPTHSALLTHHLKRLKNAGLLVLVKKSYMLPRSDFTVDNSGDTGVAAVAPPTNPHPEASADYPTGPKRSRGRPPKPKPNSTQSDLISSSQPNAVPPPNSQSVIVPMGLSMSTQPNVDSLFNDSTFTAPPAENNVPNSSHDSHLQMSGKRRPGRPKKAAGQPDVLAVVNTSGKRRGRQPKSGPLGLKKSPGRPRKPKSVAAGVKKNAKHLPKSVVVPYATGGAVPKRRGRPRKGEALAPPASGDLVVPAKRPGRKRKIGARPVGRPRKTKSQVDAYGDLKRKFEIFQSRVKQAVSLIKPTLNSETATTAIAAIQDLEEIATLDLNAPFKDEAPLTQEPPLHVQQPPLQPQSQPPEAVTHN